MRNFLIGQGYKMGPVTIYQDNILCMALAERGRSGAERTRLDQILLDKREKDNGSGEAGAQGSAVHL